MGFWGRLLWTVTGRARSRLPREIAVLGGSPELVKEMQSKTDIEQEKTFTDFVVEGRHGCILDWRAPTSEVYDELCCLLTNEEKQVLPPRTDLPSETTSAIERIRHALSRSGRTIVQTESLGDFTFLIVVPCEREAEFVRCVGPWCIVPTAGHRPAPPSESK